MQFSNGISADYCDGIIDQGCSTEKTSPQGSVDMTRQLIKLFITYNILILLLLVNPLHSGATCYDCTSSSAFEKDCSKTSLAEFGITSGDNALPITDGDTVNSRYLGVFSRGLYPGGANSLSGSDENLHHAAEGTYRAWSVQPIDAATGSHSDTGKYVLLGIGHSISKHLFGYPNLTGSFVEQAANDLTVNDHLTMINGAAMSQTAEEWINPGNPDSGKTCNCAIWFQCNNYDRIRDCILPTDVTEEQVQVVWMNLTNIPPDGFRTLSSKTVCDNPDPDPYTDRNACLLQHYIGDVARALKVRYINLHSVFISSESYRGFADLDELISHGIDPDNIYDYEPYAYEDGYAVKWAIQDQIYQMFDDTEPVMTGNMDYENKYCSITTDMSCIDDNDCPVLANDCVNDTCSLTGDNCSYGKDCPIDYCITAPWMAWGPYLWADGINPREDALSWKCCDFWDDDGMHHTNYNTCAKRPCSSDPSVTTDCDTQSTWGLKKGGDELFSFFRTSPYTAPWFVECSYLPIITVAGNTPFSSLQDAHDHPGTAINDSLRLRAKVFNESLTVTKSLTLTGGYDCTLDTVRATTYIKGDVTISGGTVKMGNITIL